MPRVRIESIGTIPPDRPVERDAVQLVKLAAEDCLERSSYDRSDIDLLIHAGVYRNDFLSEPAIAALAAGELGLNDDVESSSPQKTFAFDVFNGALGFLEACYVAVEMIRAGKHNTAMVVASEVENNAGLLPQRLLGLKETGAAVILDAAADHQSGLGNFVFKCYTDHLDAFESHTGYENGQPYLHFEREPLLEDYYLACIPETVAELLALEGLTMSQIKVIMPPQISATFLSKLRLKLGVGPVRFVDLAPGGSDYFTSSLVYAWQHLQLQNWVEPGDIGLIISVGAGLQVGCATYYF
jgi:3-oxoacyl-[acyl-carrier-protein] synthase III